MKRFYQLWSVGLVVKTALAIWLPLSNDECYYWVWGHHPQLSYFDHPGMVGWIFWLGTWLESFGNATRLPGVWIGHVTLLIWAAILRRVMNESALTKWLLFMLFSPFFGLGSLVVTPDIPLLFFWSLSLWILLKTIGKGSPQLYAALGLSLGLGFLSKYMIVIFVPTALIWLGASGEWRKIQWRWVPLTILLGLISCLPVFIWNAGHDWVSFRFQLDHGLQSEVWDWTWPFEYFGGQLLILFPLTVWCALRKRPAPNLTFLSYFAWTPLVFFFLTSFKAHVEANWPIMAHPAFLALAFVNFPNSRLLKITLGVWIVAHVALIAEIEHHWLPVDATQLKTYEFTHFDVFLPDAQRSDQPFYLGSYQAAATVSYKLRRQFYKIEGLNRRDFYDFIPESRPSRDSFLLGCENDQGLPEGVLKAGYREVSSVKLSSEFRVVEVKRIAQDSDR